MLCCGNKLLPYTWPWPGTSWKNRSVTVARSAAGTAQRTLGMTPAGPVNTRL